MSGEVVRLPRVELYRCDGCRRIVIIGSVVTLDLPDGRWVVACRRCYDALEVGLWRGFSLLWNGERWLLKTAEAGPSGGTTAVAAGGHSFGRSRIGGNA
jgi:hypothetical protein